MGRLARFIRFYTDEDDGNGGGKGVLKTVTGALLHVVDALAKPAKNFVVTLEPIQSGSGDPSPENIRPITGYTGANVYQSGADTSNPTTIPITFPTEAGTVYGGTLDVTTGVLTVKWATAKVMSFTRTNNYNFYRNTGSFAYRPLSRLYYTEQILCDRRPTITNPGTSIPADGCYVNADRAIVVRTSEPYATAAEMVTAMGGELNFCYRIDSFTIQLEPNTISMLLGENNIWCDNSDSIELQYYAQAADTAP